MTLLHYGPQTPIIIDLCKVKGDVHPPSTSPWLCCLLEAWIDIQSHLLGMYHNPCAECQISSKPNVLDVLYLL